MPQSSELAAGSGFTFEDAVTARYLTALLARGPAPGVAGLAVVSVAQQQRERGEPLDDLIVDFASDLAQARLSLQVKSSLTLSAAASNEDFRDIVRDSWATLNKPDFRTGLDRYGVAVGAVAAQRSRDLVRLCELARAAPQAAAFCAQFSPDGSANARLKVLFADVRAILGAQGPEALTDEASHRFLAHFVLIQFDFGHLGAVDVSTVVGLLQPLVADGSVDQATLLCDRLGVLARAGGAVSRVYDRAALLQDVSSVVRLAAGAHLRADLALIANLVAEQLGQIQDDVEGVRLERPRFAERIDSALAQHRLVRVRGLPGSGKSVVLRRQIEAAQARGPVLFLKADALEHRSWTAFAASLGLRVALPELLAEIGALGTATLFLDGLDRVERDQRPIIQALLNAIVETPSLSSWKVVATLRDTGVEPVRTWLPPALATQGLGDVLVDNLDSAEVEALAAERPHLRGLLFGTPALREIARRPFFAKVLALAVANGEGDAEAATSESDLIDLWWRRGGFDADGAEALHRQRALIALSQAKLNRISAPIALRDLNAETIERIDALSRDGLLATASAGHSVRFAHDIFFEWSLLHVLIDHDADWPQAVRAAGEPPAIGRVVELLAQRRFVADEDWAGTLDRLESAGLRAQWTRAWLLGPLLTSRFQGLEDRWAQTVLADDCRRLRRALVWFQAEKTTPHPGVLDGSMGAADTPPEERIRLADLLSWPSDIAAWARLIWFLVAYAPDLPPAVVVDAAAIFEVWQNLLAGASNPTSAALLEQVDLWLGQIEAFEDQEPSKAALASPWNGVAGLGGLVRALRALLLRSALTAPDRVSGYLGRVKLSAHNRDQRFEDIVALSPILARRHASQLVDLTLRRLLEELPADAAAREDAAFRAGIVQRDAALAVPEADRTREQQMAADGLFISLGDDAVSDHDWRHLAIDGDQLGYFPASPLRQPFQALFDHAPDQALRLIGRLSGHAMTAWRQLHDLDWEDRVTPIPLDIAFPWGVQRFWGGPQVYGWHRGVAAPPPLDSAYMALETWAIGQVESGRDADAVIAQILAGNDCVAVLGTALALAHHAPEPPAAAWPIVMCQRLWAPDRSRLVGDMTGSTSNLIGFTPEDTTHAQAIAVASQRFARKREIRHLAAAFVFSIDDELAERTRQAISAFPADPPFELEEQRDDEASRRAADEAAQANAAWGDLNRYRQGPDPQDPKAVAIYGPDTSKPETPDQAAASQRRDLTHRLLLWADQALQAGQPLSQAVVADALAAGRKLDDPTLFTTPPAEDLPGLEPGAVTAVATVLTLHGPAGEARIWARDILRRAAEAPEHRTVYWSARASAAWHPGVYAAKGLAGAVRHDPKDLAARRLLLGLVAHPLEAAALAGLASAFSLWDLDPRLGWCGLALGLRLCNLPRESRGPSDPMQSDTARAQALVLALDDYARAPAWPALTLPDRGRAASGRPSPAAENSMFVESVAIDSPAWNGSEVTWYGQFASQLVNLAPVAAIMAHRQARAPFAAFAQGILQWTIEKIAPSAQAGTARRRQPNRGTLYEWLETVGAITGQVCGALEPEGRARLLDPILAVDQEPRLWLLAPFVDFYIRAHVLDAPKPPKQVLDTLRPCAEILLEHHTFNRAFNRDGELARAEQRRLIKALMFVNVEARDAARFANGDWREIALVLPLVETLVSRAGWLPSVAGAFLTLCERAKAVFPAQTFADLVLGLVQDPQGLAGWRGTLLPARVAGLVQQLADREQVLVPALSQSLLRVLDALIDMGDRRSAALQQSEAFREVRLETAGARP